MKRSDWPAWIAAGAVAVSLLLVGCARDAADRPADGPSAGAPRPAVTAERAIPDTKLATVTLNVTGMT